MAESLEDYVARIKQEHEQRTKRGQGSLEFFLKHIRDLAAQAIPGRAQEDEKVTSDAAEKAHAVGQQISPQAARDRVANTNILETNTDISNSYVGKMLFFSYDPKLKQQLPYWDKYPLIFLISTHNNSGLGMNLHYLPPVERARLFLALMTLVNTKTLDPRTHLTLTYKLLANASKFRNFKPCIKRYLFNHIRSQVMVVNPEAWQEVVFLPLAGFQKQDEFRVWQDSINKIRDDKSLRTQGGTS